LTVEHHDVEPYSISYDLQGFIEELRHIFESEGKAAPKLRRLERAVDQAEKYAIEYGHLPRKQAVKK